MEIKLINRAIGFLRYRLMPPHNMLTHKAERFYFKEYMLHIAPYFVKGQRMLDIGCQMGRFTIPAALSGVSVVATDIRKRYFKFIGKKLNGKANVIFRHETLDQSLENLRGEKFDVILCLELLYNLPEPGKKLQNLALLLKPGGILITSHRSPGYYIYRFIKEKKFNSVTEIINGAHCDYNAQSVEEIELMCKTAGLNPVKITPVGIFSGFGSDAFSRIADPSKMNDYQLQALFGLETNTELMKMFENSARYNLLIAMKPEK